MYGNDKNFTVMIRLAKMDFRTFCKTFARALKHLRKMPTIIEVTAMRGDEHSGVSIDEIPSFIKH